MSPSAPFPQAHVTPGAQGGGCEELPWAPAQGTLGNDVETQDTLMSWYGHFLGSRWV